VIVEVNNLRLYDDYGGFKRFSEHIFKCKVNLLIYVSKLFPEADFVFYNVLGQYGLVENVEELLKGIFQSFNIDFTQEKKDFDSSPINNIPKVKVDGKIQVLEDVETIGLLHIDKPENLVCNYTNCYYILENFTTRDHGNNVISHVVDITPKNFVESNLVSSLNETGKRYFVLKLLRGEEICF